MASPARQVWGVAFSPDGETLAVTKWFGDVTLYDPASGEGRALDPKQDP